MAQQKTCIPRAGTVLDRWGWNSAPMRDREHEREKLEFPASYRLSLLVSFSPKRVDANVYLEGRRPYPLYRRVEDRPYSLH